MIQSNVAAFRPLRCCDKHVLSHVCITPNGSTTVLVPSATSGRTRILGQSQRARGAIPASITLSDFRACSLLPVFGMGSPTVEVLSLRRVFGALMTGCKTLCTEYHTRTSCTALSWCTHTVLCALPTLSRNRNRKLDEQIVATAHKG